MKLLGNEKGAAELVHVALVRSHSMKIEAWKRAVRAAMPRRASDRQKVVKAKKRAPPWLHDTRKLMLTTELLIRRQAFERLFRESKSRGPP